jgi:hypothetical protein
MKIEKKGVFMNLNNAEKTIYFMTSIQYSNMTGTPDSPSNVWLMYIYCFKKKIFTSFFIV